MSQPLPRRALISVHDKTGIVDFARALHDEFGIELISTGGTARLLKDSGIPVTLVEEVTGFPEMMDGRVKTLHPKIHAAILADRDNPGHMRQLTEQGIAPIDMVVVNLYPFEETIERPGCTFEQAIEMIDIGGPCLLRAAAKNHRHVFVITWWYEDALDLLRAWDNSESRRKSMKESAWEAFRLTSRYDAAVQSWLAAQLGDDCRAAATVCLAGGFRLRYGENPHQRASRYNAPNAAHSAALAVQVGGTEISYNNLLDADAALALCADLSSAASSLRHEPGRNDLWHRPPAGDVPPASGRWIPVGEQRESRRNLPHIQNPGKSYFVTFRVREGIVLSAEAKTIALNAVKYWHGRKMELHAVVIMPDHVHMLLTPFLYDDGSMVPLGELMHSIKSYSAHRINDLTGHGGPLWLDESWDRIMRNEKEFAETFEYIETNPDRKGLGDVYPWFWASGSGFEQGGRISVRGPVVDDRPEAGRTSHRPEAGATDHRPEAGATGPRPKAGATVVFIKHNNACGVGVADDPVEAYRRAYTGDVNAAMGGILACNFSITPDFAEVVMDSLARWGKDKGAGAFFLEVWIAPDFLSDDTVNVIRSRKKWGENVRLLDVGPAMDEPPVPGEMIYRSIAGGMLAQTIDNVGLNEDEWKVVTDRAPHDREMADLRLAWLVAKHTKSNAISLCRDGMLIGNGAGQMSRVMSCRIATWLATENGHADRLAGSVAASDAFFPFRDGPDILMQAGVTAIIQPGGSKRDAETVAACNERGVAMVFTGTRHFRH